MIDVAGGRSHAFFELSDLQKKDKDAAIRAPEGQSVNETTL